jgi:hypothetical protein
MRNSVHVASIAQLRHIDPSRNFVSRPRSFIAQPWEGCARSEPSVAQATLLVEVVLSLGGNVAVFASEVGSTRRGAALHPEVRAFAVCRCKTNGGRESNDEGEEAHGCERWTERGLIGA